MFIFAWKGRRTTMFIAIWALLLLTLWIKAIPRLKTSQALNFDFSFIWTSQRLENLQQANKSLLQQLEQELSPANYKANIHDQLDMERALEFGTKFSQTARKKINCVQKPSPDEILYNNRYWQVFQIRPSPAEQNITAGIFYIYNAFLDIRVKPYVRVLLISDGRLDDKSSPSMFCQFWHPNDTKVDIVKVEKFQTPWIWKTTAAKYYPYLLSCPIPIRGNGKVLPVSVSLPPVKKDFGVCFKMLHFPTTNVARKIIETIELLKIFGVGGVHFSVLSVEENTFKVLQYYQSTGYATVKMFSLPGHQPNFPITSHLYLRHNADAKRKQELIPYNDCFLSNMYKYHYIVPSDIDEILMSHHHRHYQNIFRPYWKSKLTYSSLCFDMKQFLTKIVYGPKPTDYVEMQTSQPSDPNTPEITKHVFFDKAPICNSNRKRNSKCFYRTDQLLVMHNHYEINCIESLERCRRLHINVEKAYIHHHRELSETCHYKPGIDPPELIQNPFGYDPLIQVYAAELKEKVATVVQNISNLVLSS